MVLQIKNPKNTYLNSTKISCKYLGDLHTEAKHFPSGSVISTDAPKDHDGNGEDFSPTDLLASALGTCVMTIMGIEAKRRGWKLEEFHINVYKTMTKKGPRKIKSLLLEIFMPNDLDSQRFKVLQSIAEECPVKLNLEDSVNIELNWHKGKY